MSGLDNDCIIKGMFVNIVSSPPPKLISLASKNPETFPKDLMLAPIHPWLSHHQRNSQSPSSGRGYKWLFINFYQCDQAAIKLNLLSSKKIGELAETRPRIPRMTLMPLRVQHCLISLPPHDLYLNFKNASER